MKIKVLFLFNSKNNNFDLSEHGFASEKNTPESFTPEGVCDTVALLETLATSRCFFSHDCHLLKFNVAI